MKRLTIVLILASFSISAHAERRNPFAYVTKAKPAPKAVKKEPVVIEAVQPVVIAEPEPPRRPDPPRFPYRFIGMFGHTDSPIVAFVADDRVVTVQLGASIDGQFVLRSVGLESVEIGFVNDERTVRVPLGGSP